MKVCKFCGTESQNNSTVCSACGGKSFENKCENCGTLFSEGNFCPKCGVKIGVIAKKCPNCGAEYFSVACPECGYIKKERDANVDNEKADPRPVKKRKTWLWILGWIFIFPIPLTIILAKNHRMKKWLKIVLVIAAWMLYLIIAFAGSASSDTETINNNQLHSDNTQQQEQDIDDNSSDISELSPYSENEKIIRLFVEKYNNQNDKDIQDIDWKNNHTIANIKFGNKTGRINSSSGSGFFVDFDFSNGKEAVSEYDLVVKNIVKAVDNTITDEQIYSSIQTAKENDNQFANVCDEISVKYHYVETPVGYLPGDRYMVSVTVSNFGE